VPDPVLTLLKFVFLAVLYLFFLRVLRAVWVELREPKPGTAPPAVDPSNPAAGIAPPVPLTPGAWPVAPGPATARSAAVMPDPTVGPAVYALGGPVRYEQVAKLVVVSPQQLEGREFALADEVTVGRAGGCAVLIADDTFVSQLHARIFRHDGDLFVEDLGSTNGTYLNQRKVGPAAIIRPGDRLQVGRTTLELRE
jgi:hypothetical protein